MLCILFFGKNGLLPLMYSDHPGVKGDAEKNVRMIEGFFLDLSEY